MKTITNPILRGFHPDPSIVLAGNDYYLATSTFHWFPGVAIYHSTDLAAWQLAARPLERPSQLDMRGVEPGGGIFAPCLSYAGGVFYLLYTVVYSHLGEFMDCRNYLVTASDIAGPWSEPVYLHGAGFDPSLFHDEDGRMWVASVSRRYRSDEHAGHMAGIVLQQYDPAAQTLTGPLRTICKGSGLTSPEGPHLYRHGGWYHLLCAEGGTEYGHAATMFRARDIWGPYEPHPQNPVLTARNDLTLPLQKAGHADIVQTPTGAWYMVHLCGRPLPPFRRCVLGRETAIQRVEWGADGWLRLCAGQPELYVSIEDGEGATDGKTTTYEPPHIDKHYRFGDGPLDPDFLFLRARPPEGCVSLTARPGWLRLVGQDSPHSRFDQTLLARRQQAFRFTASTCLEFSPCNERQMAGLVYIYDENNFYYARVTASPQGERVLDLLHMERGRAAYTPAAGIPLPSTGAVHLRLAVEDDHGAFCWAPDDDGQPGEWRPLATIDASRLSDEYPWHGEAAYTGAMVGMACHDMLYRSAGADFRYFTYREQPAAPGADTGDA